MRNTKSKIIIIALMLVTFIGQALASAAMSCSHEMTMELSMMAHDNVPETTSHTRIMIESSEQGYNQNASMDCCQGQSGNQSPSMDCCQEHCKCPMNGCISVSLLFNTGFHSGSIAEKKIPQLPLIHQSQLTTSLYRPPIS